MQTFGKLCQISGVRPIVKWIPKLLVDPQQKSLAKSTVGPGGNGVVSQTRNKKLSVSPNLSRRLYDSIKSPFPISAVIGSAPPLPGKNLVNNNLIESDCFHRKKFSEFT